MNRGAEVRGRFDTVKAIEPLPHQRLRPPSEPARFVRLSEIGAVCRHLAPVFQLALWLMRLLGLRIGEAYGLDVADVTERDGRMWLMISSQGGKNVVVDHAGETVFPAFQSAPDGTPRPAIAGVLAALGDRLAGWPLALWWTSADDWLGGARPVDLLGGDDKPLIITAAGRLAAELPD